MTPSPTRLPQIHTVATPEDRSRVPQNQGAAKRATHKGNAFLRSAALEFLAADNPPEDGLLQVREITRLQLNADLVTLSACQTGIGPTEGEAGVMSLEQSFLMAGAKAVVASLWSVEDQSTAVLMEAFYRHLAEHEDKAMALAHAKRDFLEQNPNHPLFYWAGFVIVGERAGTISFGK